MGKSKYPIPVRGASNNEEVQVISWNFRYMNEDEQHPYQCTFEKLHSHRRVIKAYEEKSRLEIQMESKRNHSWKKAERLNDAIYSYFEKVKPSEDCTLFQLKLSNLARLFGFYKDSVFYVLVLDENHTGYIVSKKGT